MIGGKTPLVSSFLQDKILLSGGKNGSVTVTNDGATILKAIGVDNPAAKVLVGKGLERNVFFFFFYFFMDRWTIH